MFTGLIDAICVVKNVKNDKKAFSITLDFKELRDKNIKIGDSVSINGACLSVTSFFLNIASFDVMKETLKGTTLSKLSKGDRVNVETSLKVGDKIAGHFVTGHIDCVGSVRSIKKARNDYALEIEMPIEKSIYLVEKGSVAVDGVSLTLQEVVKNRFKVSLIPLTLSHTSLHLKKVKDQTNIELDILGKYALSRASESKKEIDKEFLRHYGFA